MDNNQPATDTKSKLNTLLMLMLTFIGVSLFLLFASYLILLHKSLDRQGYYVHQFLKEEHLASMFYIAVAAGFSYFIWRCIKIVIRIKKEKICLENIQGAFIVALFIFFMTFMIFLNTQIRFELLKIQDINVILEDATLEIYEAYSPSRFPHYQFKNAQFRFIREQSTSLIEIRKISNLYATNKLVTPIEPPYYDLHNLSRVELKAGLSPLFAFYYLVIFQFLLTIFLKLCIYLPYKVITYSIQRKA